MLNPSRNAHDENSSYGKNKNRQALSAYGRNGAFQLKKQEPPRITCKLLLLSLLESVCKLSQKTPESSKNMFLYIAYSLRNSGLIENEFSEDYEAIRVAYSGAIHELLAQAHNANIGHVSDEHLFSLNKTTSFMSVLSDESLYSTCNEPSESPTLPDSVDAFTNIVNHVSSHSDISDSTFLKNSPLNMSGLEDYFSPNNTNFENFYNVQKSRYSSDFEELEMLGKGGYGYVYKARNKFDGVEYALKKIPLTLRSLSSSNMFRESRILARLNHPNIIRFYSSWIEIEPYPHNDPAEFDSTCTEDLLDSRSIDSNGGDNLLFDIETDSLDRDFSSANSFQVVFEEDSLGTHFDPSYSTKQSTCSLAALFSGYKESEQEYSKMHSCEPVYADKDDSIYCEKENRSKRLNNCSLSSRFEDSMTHEVPCFDQRPICLYIQMALCEETLEIHLNRRNKHFHGMLPKNLRNRYILLFSRILEGVMYLHNVMNLVHHDLKPRNIFLSSSTSSEQGSVRLPCFSGKPHLSNEPIESKFFVPKIGDFGLVLSQSDDGDSSEENGGFYFAGTHTYAAPEMLSRHMKAQAIKNSTAIDVYALGILFFELLYPFGTRMERVSLINNLKKGLLPEDFLEQMPGEASLILSMLSSPAKRPTAAQILKTPIFSNMAVNELHLYEALLDDVQQQNNSLKAELETLKSKLVNSSS
ncbi:PEK protein kinase Hri1 [Schizosaccharomyces cryophilus OY26]|uniref:non-specific serine/threonine protein kinase n=1 Tax=Schizosaccharomyces cryophilus (strain OY26 / ATCC MYA-4695 / CBS 11777 / NBRC 106824 / NRRL Y48691) TaxID=653667 RepID=S9VVY9_SCHCR|nr:PEK protein kinase Hri1 [Schizosaccharomyces cryophilus OY26]EPY50364.1 PEK protein kinase Hri1 [Schizosaccharomyces cryophilus OY26]